MDAPQYETGENIAKNDATKPLFRLPLPNELVHHPNICSPIKSLAEVSAYLKTLPDWVKSIIDLEPRSDVVIQNHTTDCHVESHHFAPKVRLDRNFVPKTLVCHDMKNGYLEDKYVGRINIGNGYTFYHWSQIDIFVYFSHHLITIPPLSWINVAHKNGVPILGTFITEWNDGKAICDEIFKDLISLTTFADTLVDICIIFKLDGWLLNIENTVDSPVNLREFVRYLTEQLHRKKLGTYVIWYDSVTINGELKWQNELNASNRCYFDVCDGIFLNYTWNVNNLKNTVCAAQHRILDVFVGVDIFGRGCFGGGKFNSHVALKAIREHNLSLAIFGQGWTHETLAPEPQEDLLERFFTRDNAFWKSLWPYLYTHPISSAFETFFHTGVDKQWYLLEQQNTQLSKIPSTDKELEEIKDVETLKDTCKCLQLHVDNNYTLCHITNERLDNYKTYVHRLFSCDIQVNRNVVLYTYTKKATDDDPKYDFSVVLLIQVKNKFFKKIICKSAESHIDGSNPNVIEVNPSQNCNLLSRGPIAAVPSSWNLKCFNLDFENAKILEIGVVIPSGESICLCGMGITTEN